MGCTMTMPSHMSSQPSLTEEPDAWPLHAARATAIGVDYGYSHDHTAIVSLAEFAQSGRLVHVSHIIKQFPLQTPPDLVRAKLAKIASSIATARHRPQIVVDSRSNSAFFHAVVQMGFSPAVVGVSATGSEHHAQRPEVQLVPTNGGQGRVAAAVWSISRNQAVEAVGAALNDRSLVILDQGDANTLKAEMSGLRRVITTARNIRYEPPAGGHDDLLMGLAYALFALRHLPRRQKLRKPPRRGRAMTNSAGWT